MLEVKTITGVVAAYISNYYPSQNQIALVQSSSALHKYTSSEYFFWIDVIHSR